MAQGEWASAVQVHGTQVISQRLVQKLPLGGVRGVVDQQADLEIRGFLAQAGERLRLGKIELQDAYRDRSQRALGSMSGESKRTLGRAREELTCLQLARQLLEWCAPAGG